ncbi:hypothetical protein HY489_06650 [Candidatus Woesearchaeota archaeon]|nr:hypothetical protein [Candidatus Woesearchaeota archaeon]
MNWKIFIGILLIAGVAGAWIVSTTKSTATGLTVQPSETRSQNIELTVYKSPGCGCCGGYIQELQTAGYKVNIVEKEDIAAIKSQYGVPASMESCHTTIAGKYFIEGHAPIAAINKLLAEQPDADGIALPGMPSGAPGMSGAKKAPFVVYSVKDGKASEFMTI